MGKHRHERFRPAFVVFRIDEYHSPGIPSEQLITAKEAYLTVEEAESEALRLNALNRDKSCRYFVQYTRLERDPAAPAPAAPEAVGGVPWWQALREGRLGRLTSRATADAILELLGSPEEHLRSRADHGVWSVLWQYGALQCGFSQTWNRGLFPHTLSYLLIEFDELELEIPAELGLELEPLRRGTPVEDFRRLAAAHDLALRDVTPAPMAGAYTWLAGPADVYAAFTRDEGLYAIGAPAP